MAEENYISQSKIEQSVYGERRTELFLYERISCKVRDFEKFDASACESQFSVLGSSNFEEMPPFIMEVDTVIFCLFRLFSFACNASEKRRFISS